MCYSTRKLGLVSKYFVTDYRSKSMNLNDISSCSKASNMLLSSNVHAVQRKPSSLNTSIKINYFCGFFFVYYGICIVSKYFFFFQNPLDSILVVNMWYLYGFWLKLRQIHFKQIHILPVTFLSKVQFDFSSLKGIVSKFCV